MFNFEQQCGGPGGGPPSQQGMTGGIGMGHQQQQQQQQCLGPQSQGMGGTPPGGQPQGMGGLGGPPLQGGPPHPGGRPGIMPGGGVALQQQLSQPVCIYFFINIGNIVMKRWSYVISQSYSQPSCGVKIILN